MSDKKSSPLANAELWEEWKAEQSLGAKTN